jgi:hypothetical protein
MSLDSSASGNSIALLAPGSSLLFSLIVAALAPHYANWFGAAMPALTRGFIAWYPLWIAISAIAVVVQLCARVLAPKVDGDESLRTLDTLLGIASVAVIAIGIIALALPAVLAPSVVG